MAKHNTTVTQLSPDRFVRERGRSIPVEVCYLAKESIQEHGEGMAVVVRQHKGGKRTLGCYLIDTWCIGVKDAFYMLRLEEDEYADFLERIREQGLEEVPYLELHNWVFGAVEFAAEAGLSPCKSFAVSKYLLEDDEDESIPIFEYEFGRNGKHCLVCNSLDELLRLQPTLDENLGEGNFTWMLGGVSSDSDDTEDDEASAKVFFDIDTLSRRLTLRIELSNVKPLVWRKVAVPSNMRLGTFHELIQEVFGWENYHLHAFATKERSIEENEENDYILADFFQKKGDKLRYEYDFGDGWVHKIELMSDPMPDEDPSVVVLGGKNACPPEDFGGPWRYTDFLAALSAGDTKRLNAEFSEMKDWLDDDFDPSYFDKEEAQAAVDSIFE